VQFTLELLLVRHKSHEFAQFLGRHFEDVVERDEPLQPAISTHDRQPAYAARAHGLAFVNEEPPYFMTENMGSFRYAAEAAARGDDIVVMISLETIGYYSDAPGSQRYPRPFHLLFSDRGNFLAMVSNMGSMRALRTASRAFRSATRLPLIASPAPASIPGVAWSDHWSFWQHGYRALMLTDTAPYRYPHYHLATDTPERLDYDTMAQVVTGCAAAIRAWD